jgi:hypothetical protein
MRRPSHVLTALLAAIAAVAAADHAADSRVHLTGRAEIPSTYRHPGPMSGQFTTGPVNVTPSPRTRHADDEGDDDDDEDRGDDGYDDDATSRGENRD